MTDIRLIAGWLTDLVDLTAGTAPLADAKAKIAALTKILAEEFPPQAFTPKSLEAVAAACKFFPAYGELKKALSAWWKENKPAIRALPGAGLSAEDQACVTVWLKRRAAGEIKDLANSLDMLRVHKTAAWRHLIATDPECQRIASQRRQTDPTPELQQARDSWRDITPEEVRRKVRILDGHPFRLPWGKALAAALNRSAPQHLGWLPPEFLADLPQPPATVVPFQPPDAAD